MSNLNAMRAPAQRPKSGPRPGRRQHRFLALQQDEATDAIVDPETRCLTVSFSSEQPVHRWFGDEVLSHAPGAADLSRLNDSAPLLFNHGVNNVIGVVEKAWIGSDRRGYATIRFATTANADEIVGMIDEAVLRNVSFAYEVDKFVPGELDADGQATSYIATRWHAYELSIVSVPADQSVGIGRSHTERNLAMENIEGDGSPLSRSQRQAADRRERTDGAIALARDEARDAERLRVLEIEATGRKYKFRDDEIARLVNDGVSVETVRGIALERTLAYGREQQPMAGWGGDSLGMSSREVAQFSIVKSIRAQLNHDWTDAGFERAAMDAERQAMKANGQVPQSDQSIIVPRDVLRGNWTRDARAAGYLVGTAGAGTTGGTLVATNLLAGEWISVLRKKSATGQLGARMLPGLIGNVDIPRQTAATASYWVGESSAVTESQGTFDKVSLSPKTLGALSTISRNMLLQSTPAIESIVREDLVRICALAIDLAAISGPGTGNSPKGIVGSAGVGAVLCGNGTDGGLVSFDSMIALRNSIMNVDADQGELSYCMNSKVFNYLSGIKATTGSYLWAPGGSVADGTADRLLGCAYARSNQLRSTLTKGASNGICSEVICGDFQQLLIGSWGALEILVNPYGAAQFNTGDIAIRALQTVDIGLRHAASFAVASDALTTGY